MDYLRTARCDILDTQENMATTSLKLASGSKLEKEESFTFFSIWLFAIRIANTTIVTKKKPPTRSCEVLMHDSGVHYAIVTPVLIVSKWLSTCK